MVVLRSQIDPKPEPLPEDLPPELAEDSAPTIAVDLPEGMSFDDFDAGDSVGMQPGQESSGLGAPAVHFDPDVDGTLDDDGIPIWEDPA